MTTKTRAEAAEEWCFAAIQKETFHTMHDGEIAGRLSAKAWAAGIEWFIEHELRGLLEDARETGGTLWEYSIAELIQRAKVGK